MPDPVPAKTYYEMIMHLVSTSHAVANRLYSCANILHESARNARRVDDLKERVTAFRADYDLISIERDLLTAELEELEVAVPMIEYPPLLQHVRLTVVKHCSTCKYLKQYTFSVDEVDVTVNACNLANIAESVATSAGVSVEAFKRQYEITDPAKVVCNRWEDGVSMTA